MIHEVMVLDHGGPDFGFVLYGARLKLWVFGALLVGLVRPAAQRHPWLDAGRRRWRASSRSAVRRRAWSNPPWRGCDCVRVPQLLVGAGVLAALRSCCSVR